MVAPLNRLTMYRRGMNLGPPINKQYQYPICQRKYNLEGLQDFCRNLTEYYLLCSFISFYYKSFKDILLNSFIHHHIELPLNINSKIPSQVHNQNQKPLKSLVHFQRFEI